MVVLFTLIIVVLGSPFLFIIHTFRRLHYTDISKSFLRLLPDTKLCMSLLSRLFKRSSLLSPFLTIFLPLVLLSFFNLSPPPPLFFFSSSVSHPPFVHSSGRETRNGSPPKYGRRGKLPTGSRTEIQHSPQQNRCGGGGGGGGLHPRP